MAGRGPREFGEGLAAGGSRTAVFRVHKQWICAMPFILIFFGVIGGALGIWMIGVFLGPPLLAVAYRLVDEWSPAWRHSGCRTPQPPS